MTYTQVLTVNEAPQFKLPDGVKAWCHGCERGFKSIDDLQEHKRTTVLHSPKQQN